MAKVTVISSQRETTESEPQTFTQVGGIYGSEIRPEDFLVSSASENVEQERGEREPRFFRVR